MVRRCWRYGRAVLPCMTGGSFGFAMGDLIGLSCALLVLHHITVIDHFSPMVDGVKMSCIQFFHAMRSYRASVAC